MDKKTLFEAKLLTHNHFNILTQFLFNYHIDIKYNFIIISSTNILLALGLIILYPGWRETIYPGKLSGKNKLVGITNFPGNFLHRKIAP